MADCNLKNNNTPGDGNGINQSNAQNSSLSESIRQSAENNMNLDTDYKDLNQLNSKMSNINLDRDTNLTTQASMVTTIAGMESKLGTGEDSPQRSSGIENEGLSARDKMKLER